MLKPMRAKDGAPRTVAEDPVLLAAWSPRNGDLAPEELGYRSRRQVWWRCAADPSHEWQAAPVAMKGCQVCADAKGAEAPRDSGIVPSGQGTGASAPPPAPPIRPFRVLPIDLDVLEDAFSDGALCFLNPATGEIFLPRKWREECPDHVRVPRADKRRWLPDFIATYVTRPERRALLHGAPGTSEFLQRLDEREEVQWSAYSAARCGMELRAWLEGLGIRAIPRRSGRG